MDRDNIAKRLAFLWHKREIEPGKYIAAGLGVEKESIYQMCGHDNEIMDKAREYYNEPCRSKFVQTIKEGSSCKVEVHGVVE